ncbi:MAG TPA: dihydrolipoyllysine-residue succinyltransferase, partial [Ferruginibacter sp.]|nr:dihydrolipoyllysine-residue succinyltransferase [Ferruginibacter sp.]
MSIEIKVPTVGESINEVTLVKWHKKDGDWVNRDEVIAELESEKATFELNAEQAGAIKIIAKEGDTLHIGDVVCSIDTAAAKPAEAAAEEKAAPAKAKEEPKKETAKPVTETPQPDIKAT